jgi:putative ABC transport system permease protein
LCPTGKLRFDPPPAGPAFTITTITVLAFGIGPNSALFVIDTVLLKPLPFPEPDRLVQIMEANPARSERLSLISPAHLDDWNRMSQTFEVISGSYRENVTDTSQSEPDRLNGRRVALDFSRYSGCRRAWAARSNQPRRRQAGRLQQF